VSVIVVGLNHRTAPLDLLERLAIPAGRVPKALADLGCRDTLDEVVVLSTCMRTEVYATAERFHPAVQDIRNFLCEMSFTAPEDLSDHLTVLYDDAAIGHLFTVAAGLDSAVLGESKVLGQVRGAWDQARAEATIGPVLSGLFRHAVEVGKRVRSETAIARGTTSVSQAAVQLAARHLETPLSEHRALILGAGEMGEGMAVALAGAGVGDIQVANRTSGKAAELAARVGGRAVDIADLDDHLSKIDVLLTSTGADEPLLTVDDIGSRAERPLLIVDIAVPRDVEPAVRSLPGVTVLDLDDLRKFTRTGLDYRRREVGRVQSIIDEEVGAYLGDVLARQAAPTVAALHSRGEEIREAELDRFRARLESLEPSERDAVAALTKGLVAKLLHEPTVRLNDAAGTPRGERLGDALRSLFDLD
jgi:glutamyl-tRNA reductase